MPVFRKRLHQRRKQRGTTCRCNRIDLPVGALLLRLFAHRNQPLFGQSAEGRVNRAEARLNEMLKAAFLEILLNLVSGRVSAAQDSETDGANVHLPLTYIA